MANIDLSEGIYLVFSFYLNNQFKFTTLKRLSVIAQFLAMTIMSGR